jgi:hypothetical protein
MKVSGNGAYRRANRSWVGVFPQQNPQPSGCPEARESRSLWRVKKMRTPMRIALMTSCLSLLYAGAILGQGVEVKITNDGTEDILVTVYDRTTNPERAVLTRERINGFTSVPISLAADATGRASLSWTATSTGTASPKCGHADTVVGNADSVNVHVDSSCGA